MPCRSMLWAREGRGMVLMRAVASRNGVLTHVEQAPSLQTTRREPCTPKLLNVT